MTAPVSGLQPCPACSQQIAISAKSCPNCGRQIAEKDDWVNIVGIVVIVLIVFMGVIFLG